MRWRIDGASGSLVTGGNGQVGRALLRRTAGGADVDVVCVGRPELDLADPRHDRPRHSRACGCRRRSSTPPPIPPSTRPRASRRPRRSRQRRRRRALLAARAPSAGIPLIHLSTDYVFDGTQGRSPTSRTTRSARSASTALSKAAGERAVAAAHPGARDPADGLGLQPVRPQFRQDHAAARAPSETSCASSPTSTASPTAAADIADGILAVARSSSRTAATTATAPSTSPAPARPPGRTSPTAIFARVGRTRRPVRACRPDHQRRSIPRPARRPANSRLDCAKLARVLRRVAAGTGESSLGRMRRPDSGASGR